MTTTDAVATTPATPPSTQTSALTSLSGNFNDFLKLLMTQLQNQDPTNPTDTSQFTTELVQFTGVGQQISTNANLTQLIQLTQGTTMLQASAMVGKQVQMQSGTLALQNGAAALQYTPPAAGPVSITVSTAAGTPIRTVTQQAAAGPNTWRWNGADNTGQAMPDGPYTVSVTAAGGAQVPFTTTGTVTGIIRQGGSLDLQLGPTNADFGTVQQVL